ncbi:hypothetical protein QBC33DRAFT_564416 [Phialemonium atrogriseum]|uniref:Uncharacterized protein n=1 Tax=Phialemonium atrogriseum TaxID=1093897 RepID=A0AAJ0BPR0_9PEZI|nr:uncharacterized protein QBC33DRAFT_564416 [Phialemonium atrogriseum]KAK1761822.1 hypothetical protein QBC33DRAFT_564416 [Phialemonium atrogriseum]
MLELGEAVLEPEKWLLQKIEELKDLAGWVGLQPAGAEPEDEGNLAPIDGVDEEDGKSLEEEMTVLSERERQDLVVRD